MAEIIDRKLQQIEGVSENQTAVVKLPIGLTYHGLQIPYSNLTLDEITEARLIANGDVIQRFRGVDFLDTVNQFDRRSAAAGVIVWDFERYGLLVRDARELTAIGTGLRPGNGEGQDPRPITSLQVELDIGATASASAPSIPYVVAYQSRPRPSGTIRRITRRTYNPGGTGEYEISDLAPVSGRVSRIWFQQAGIDSVRIERDGAVAFERTKAENEQVQADGIRTPQAGLYVVDRTERGWGADPFDVRGVQDFRVKLSLSSAAQIVVYMEELDAVRKF